MAKNDWYEAGEQIRQLVQDAVDNRDFSQLSGTITDVINSTVDGIQAALKENLGQNSGNQGQAGKRETGGSANVRSGQGAAGQAGTSGFQNASSGQGTAGQTGTGGFQNASSGQGAAGQAGTNGFPNVSPGQGAAGQAGTGGFPNVSPGQEAAERIRRRLQEKQRQQDLSAVRKSDVPARVKAPGEFAGKLMKWFGYGMSVFFGFFLAVLLIVSFSTGENLSLPIALMALMTGMNGVLASRGAERVGLANRFRRYKGVIGDRTACMLEELAASVGRSVKFVRKDLRTMIGKGYFREGYLVQNDEMLITDHSAYQKYQEEAQRGNGRERIADGQPGREDAWQEDKEVRELTPECRELIAEGRKYIQHVQECNEKIEDAQMSARLDRLELVITRIFREAEKNPSLAGDLRKMMSYYLPTTRKLLDAYCEMDAQPIQGQNIKNTQKEIESALDTINTAFENLLDSFFEDKAWDISSDITVLNTMLAQEGLTGKDFEQKGRKEK